MNGLVLRDPTCMAFSDSYPLGLGGFTQSGRSWRLKLNPALVAHGKDILDNVLELLGMAITLWLSLIECEELGLVNELLLILGDSTSAISWIIRSSLPKSSVYRPAVLFIARKNSVHSLQVTKLHSATTPTRKSKFNCRLVVF